MTVLFELAFEILSLEFAASECRCATFNIVYCINSSKLLSLSLKLESFRLGFYIILGSWTSYLPLFFSIFFYKLKITLNVLNLKF